ncbi:MAG: GHKL domain-containing protein [Oscillospiraceae bacterium]
MERLLAAFNYGLVLLFGVFLSVLFAGGAKSRRDRLMILLFVIFTLALQTACSLFFGLDITTKIYPLIAHLPLILFLVLALKKSAWMSVVSVLTAYFCCQLPRWVGVLAQQICHTRTLSLLTYSIAAVLFFLLICRFFTKPAHQAMTYSRQSLFLFGCLPAVYYVFDYASTVYTDILYTGIKMMSEFLPTVMVLFYVWFIVAYHGQVQQKTKIQLDNEMLSYQLKQVGIQMQEEQKTQELSRVYRHDMRHHFALLKGLLADENVAEALQYINTAQGDIDTITTIHYCLNSTVNLILSSFVAKGAKMGVTLKIEADLPQQLSLSETELCAILSNGIENAMTATGKLAEGQKNINIHLSLHKGNLLLSIENPYEGMVRMENGLPQNDAEGHGFGVRSIEMLTRKHNGYCSFTAQGGLFILKVVLPLCAPELQEQGK